MKKARKARISRVIIRNSTTAVNELLQHLWNLGVRDPQRILTLASLRLHHLQTGDGAGWAARVIHLQREYREALEADEARTMGQGGTRPLGPSGPRRAA